MTAKQFSMLIGLSAGIATTGALAQIGPIQRVEQTSVFDSSDWKQVEAPCPAGTIAFSGGASVTDGVSVTIHQSLPLGNPPSSWLAVAQERTAINDSWELTSWALCATVAGYELVDVSTPFDSTSPKNVFAFCPPGKVPIGGGGGIFVFSPNLALERLSLAGMGWAATAVESPSTSGSWILDVKVSCAPALDIKAVSVDTHNEAEGLDDLAFFCPASRIALGGGVTLDNGWVTSSEPLSSEGWYLAGRRRAGGANAAWRLSGWLLCYLP